MGIIFEGNPTTLTSSGVAQIIDPATGVRNVVQESVITSVLGNRPIVPDLLTNLQSGANTKFNAYYNRGKNGVYYAGLPKVEHPPPHASYDVVNAAILDANNNQPLRTVIQSFGELDVDFFAFDWLSKHEPTFSEFNKTVKGQLITSIEQLNSTQVRIKAGNSYDVVATVYTTYGEMIPGYWYNYVYYYLDEYGNTVGRSRYFNYLNNYGTYPALEVDPDDATGDYFPLVPIAYNHNNLTAEPKDTTSNQWELWRQRKQQIALLGGDYVEIGSSFFDQNESDTLDLVVFVIGSPCNIRDQSIFEYFYCYFRKLMNIQILTKKDFEGMPYYGTPNYNVISIEDSTSNINYSIKYLYVTTNSYAGTLGSKYELEIKQRTSSYRVDTSTSASGTGEVPEKEHHRGTASSTSYAYDSSSVIIKFQDGTNKITEYELVGATITETAINLNDVAAFDSHNVGWRYSFYDLFNQSASEAPYAVIPVDYKVWKEVKPIPRDRLNYFLANTKYYSTEATYTDIGGFLGKILGGIVRIAIAVTTGYLINGKFLMKFNGTQLVRNLVATSMVTAGITIATNVLGIQSKLVKGMLYATGIYFIPGIKGLLPTTRAYTRAAVAVNRSNNLKYLKDLNDQATELDEQVKKTNDDLYNYESAYVNPLDPNVKLGYDSPTTLSPSDYVEQTLEVITVQNDLVHNMTDYTISYGVNLEGVSEIESLNYEVT